MPLVKKVNDLWQPAENPNLKVGEIIEVTDYETLVKSGMAVLSDAAGNELELPGQMFDCPICFQKVEGASGLMTHLSTHLKKNRIAMAETLAENKEQSIIEEAPVKQESPEVEVKKSAGRPAKVKQL